MSEITKFSHQIYEGRAASVVQVGWWRWIAKLKAEDGYWYPFGGPYRYGFTRRHALRRITKYALTEFHPD